MPSEAVKKYHPLQVKVAFHSKFSCTTRDKRGGSVCSYDGDRRAACLLLDDSKPTIRRREYDVARENQALYSCRFPQTIT